MDRSPGTRNTPRTLSVYSNCNKVSLYHNEKLLGEKQKDISKFPASGLTWDVNFLEGENKLIAIGISNEGEKVSDTLTVNYRFEKNDTAAGLKLSSKKLDNGNYLVTATAVDDKGLRCLDYEKKVYFQCLEGGETIKSQGTPTGSEEIAMSNGKASIEVKPNQKSGKITMMVLNQSFKGTYLNITNN